MGYYHNVESRRTVRTSPWYYKAWICCMQSDELNFFVFKAPVPYDVASRVIRDYLCCYTTIYPIHGPFLWFFDTVHMLYDQCNVHFEKGCVAEENRLRRYLDGPLAFDCNIVHLLDGFTNEYGTTLCAEDIEPDDDDSDMSF